MPISIVDEGNFVNKDSKSVILQTNSVNSRVRNKKTDDLKGKSHLSLTTCHTNKGFLKSRYQGGIKYKKGKLLPHRNGGEPGKAGRVIGALHMSDWSEGGRENE